MKRFKNAGMLALTVLLSASFTFNVISPLVEKQVLAYDQSQVLSDADLQEAQNDFEAYKQTKYAELCAHTAGNSGRAYEYLNAEHDNILNYPYNADRSFNENVAAYNTYMDTVWAEIYEADDMDSFDAYKTEQINQVYDVIATQYNGMSSDRVRNYLDTELANVSDYPYYETMTLEDNIRSFNACMSYFNEGLQLCFDMDSFDAYKNDQIDMVYSVVATQYNGSTSDRVYDYLDAELPDAVNYPYNESMTLTENINSFNTFMDNIWSGLNISFDADSFEEYKAQQIDQVYAVIATQYNGLTSDRVRDYLDNELSDVTDYPFYDNMTLSENINSFNACMSYFYEGLQLCFDMDSFDAYKTEQISQVYDVIATQYNGMTSDRVRDYLDAELAGVTDYPYSDALTLNENIYSFNAYMSNFYEGLNLRFDMDSFDEYKTQQISQVYDVIYTQYRGTTTSDRVRDYLDAELAGVTDFPYSDVMTLDENIRSFNAYMSYFYEGLNLRFDMDSFDAYKADYIAQLTAFADNHATIRVFDYMDLIVEDISRYPYNSNYDLQWNISQFNNYTANVYTNVELYEAMDEFDSYKDDIVSDLDNSGSIAYEQAADTIEFMEYNVALSLDDNKAAINTIVATASVAAAEELEDTEVFTNVNLETYDLLDGQDSEWTVGDEDGLTLRCEGGIDSFRGIIIDGSIVDPSLYTTYEGSTYCVLSEELLTSLSTGDHSLVFVYTDGISEVTRFSTAEANDTTTSTTSTASSTTEATEATTEATTASVLGETRTTEETSTEAASAVTEATTETTVQQVTTAAPAAQTTQAAAATASTGEAASRYVIPGILLIAGAAVVLAVRNRKFFAEER